MSAELKTGLKVALRRNELIPALLASDTYGVYQPLRPSSVRTIELLLTYYVKGFRPTQGTEQNLSRALEMAENGNRITFTPGHLSDGDHVTIEEGFKRLGFHSLKSPHTVYPAGLKMIERPYMEFFSHAVNKSLIATDRDYQLVDSLLKRGLSGEQRQLLEELKGNYDRLNAVSLRRTMEQAKMGKAVVVYPEGTRSRNGLLQEAPTSRGEAYFKKGMIVPVSCRGVERMLPAEKFPRFWRRFNIQLAVGEPYFASELWTEEFNAKIAELGVRRVDVVMAQIARLNWDGVDPSFKARYQRIVEAVPLATAA